MDNLFQPLPLKSMDLKVLNLEPSTSSVKAERGGLSTLQTNLFCRLFVGATPGSGRDAHGRHTRVTKGGIPGMFSVHFVIRVLRESSSMVPL